jgi:hypothetical protein
MHTYCQIIYMYLKNNGNVSDCLSLFGILEKYHTVHYSFSVEQN